MESDRGLVEHVERVDQRGPECGRQIDALELAAGERARLAIEREVLEADGHQVAEPAPDLVEDEPGGLLGLARRKRERVEEGRRLADREAGDLGDRLPADTEVERLGADAGPAARRTEPVRAVAR